MAQQKACVLLQYIHLQVRNMTTTNPEILKAVAAKHLDEGGKILAIGHSKEPQSIWKNPKLYPQMFPWLFPYGLGGIGHERQRHRLSDAEHK